MNFPIYHNKPTIGREEVEAVAGSLENLELTGGSKVGEFETAFSSRFVTPSVATSSGTSALHLALIALGITDKDEVILPSYTCLAVALPVLYQGALPVLADIGSDFNISTSDIREKITYKTKAVIVPHMFGYPADLDEIRELCDDKNIYLIEDCAQSIGAEYKGEKVGTLGDISIFSFYATKMISTIQGGMVCTNNSEWVRMIKDLRYHDQVRADEDLDPRLKYSYSMSDVGAAMGLVQLKRLDEFIGRRRAIAKIYGEELDDSVMKPVESEHRKHVFSRFVVRTRGRSEEIIAGLKRSNITCAMMHNPPLHRRVLVKKFNQGCRFPGVDEAIASAVSLPIYPSLTDEETQFVADKFNKILGSLF